MNRRSLFGKLGAVAAAVAVAPVVKAEAVQADPVAALVDDVIANPGKHPEIEARASELRGMVAGQMQTGALAGPGLFDVPAPGITTLTVSGNVTINGSIPGFYGTRTEGSASLRSMLVGMEKMGYIRSETDV